MKSIKTRTANLPCLDDQDCCKGVIEDISYQEGQTVHSKGKIEKYADKIAVKIIGEGTLKPIAFRCWLETTTSPLTDDKGKYNLLTTFLLSLGELTEEQLSNPKLEVDLGKLIGKKIKFKVVANRKKRGLHNILFETIQYLEPVKNIK